ncbi:P-loop containing nucleoside triphosphate hydrolase protein, partial [Amanita muscaria]
PTNCHPGTRETSCKSIREWMLDPAGSPLLWLHGPAGVGKSTIAKTISTLPANQIRVVGTFFFSTCSDKSAAKLFATLAWQLAKNVPETEKHIVAALKHDPSLMKRELQHQFDRLIVQPLKKRTSNSTETSPLLMVIDGVDECVDENMQVEFLNILERAGAKGDLPLRFLICSRPERRIRNILETTDLRHHKVISRIKIGLSEESKEDVKKYLTDKFKEIRSPDPIKSEAIDELVKKSCGHFLYASIIV